MQHLIKLELSIDALNPNHVAAFNSFVAALGQDIEKAKNLPVEAPEVVAPKKPAKAKPVKAEEPKAEETKAEETKAEETKAEEPKAEETKAEETKAEETKAEETKAEETKAEPKVDILTIRAEWVKKQDGKGNKDLVKAELNRLGSNNLTSLDPKHYDDFYAFIKNLKA